MFSVAVSEAVPLGSGPILRAAWWVKRWFGSGTQGFVCGSGPRNPCWNRIFVFFSQHLPLTPSHYY